MVVEVKESKSRPEFNGVHVKVIKYLEGSNEYKVEFPDGKKRVVAS